ncbi:MAG: TetR/AcrR family transcriptional regulator C-terminal domain-containing protein [Actinobacteria bacterium]|nr:TetR/AcrR family transcriptional regulator C-terminal domain-containing protein [Actinomycetota bacterium]
MPPRKLTQDAVISAGMAMADESGLDGLTMRALARRLGVEAMSLYHHVANKEALLDLMVDRIYREIELPQARGQWRAELRRRSLSVRAVLHRHPWALPLMESRHRPGPANLAYHDANIGCLREAGFTGPQVAFAYAVIDAFVYGFVLQESTLPFDSGPEAASMIVTDGFGDALRGYAHMMWFAEQVILAPGYSFDREFEPGLDLVLDGIEHVVLRGAS